ncbi:hypothetical protein AQUCO_04700088v1 [Aquilegia coerulea]|uniref:Uncharacterized protein n=1 Tax=Aquilegia coerulea TaxID=218851 RepID=A0A2G5CMA5_AQUCA|nr:hypothetical protein AQUCO_04700088v1 [Aquilegia coerulea]
MKKQEAEKHVVHLENQLKAYETKCAMLSDELKEKKEEIIVVQGKLEELELKKIGIEDEILGYKRMCEELKEKDTRLEEDYKLVCEREKRSRERAIDLKDELKNERERIIELEMENRDLECQKRRAENETNVWEKRFKELETQVLSKSKIPKDVDVDPTVLSNEQKKINRQQCKRNCPLHGRCLSHMEIKERTLYSDERVYASANADSFCHPLSKERGIEHLAGSEVEHGSIATEQMGFLLDGSTYKMQTSPKPCIITEGINDINNIVKEMESSTYSARKGAERIPSDFFKVSGNSSKISGNSTADNVGKIEIKDSESVGVGESLNTFAKHGSIDSSKEAKSSSPENEDGITKFLGSIRKLKAANKLKWNKTSLVVRAILWTN